MDRRALPLAPGSSEPRIRRGVLHRPLIRAVLAFERRVDVRRQLLIDVVGDDAVTTQSEQRAALGTQQLAAGRVEHFGLDRRVRGHQGALVLDERGDAVAQRRGERLPGPRRDAAGPAKLFEMLLGRLGGRQPGVDGLEGALDLGLSDQPESLDHEPDRRPLHQQGEQHHAERHDADQVAVGAELEREAQGERQADRAAQAAPDQDVLVGNGMPCRRRPTTHPRP